MNISKNMYCSKTYLQSEFEAWKQEFVFLLKKISLANHNKQLVLKSPPNTARIKLLLSLFPNAKFIFIHRNPYEVYVSNKQVLESDSEYLCFRRNQVG